MSKNIINVGASANDRQGDSLRTAFIKINGNFDELYSAVEGFDLTNSIPTLSGNAGKYLSNTGSSLVWNTIDIPTDISDLTDTTNILAGLDATVYIGEDAPLSPVQGKLWYETESGRTYIYYDTSWVDANPKGASGSTLPNQNTNAGKFLTTDGSNLSWATVSGGSADLGKFVINGGNILATVNDSVPGAFGDYNINIDPGGESSAGISIPSVPNQVSGGTLQIFNTSSSGGKIMMTTYGGMTVSSARGTLGLGLDLEAPGAPSHFHVAFETSNTYIPTADLYFGDDYNYLRLVNAAQGVFIGTNNRSGGDQQEWRFQTDGVLELPTTGIIKQNNSWTRTTDCILFASAPADDVIWTSTVDYISSVKLTIQLETNEIGDATGWHSQVCEAVIASRGYANGTTGYGDPAMTVYGVTYTSTVPLATFTVQRNPTTKMIEVVATRTAATDSNLDFRIHSVEMSTKD